MDYYIGLDIGGTKISVVLSNEKCEILHKIKFYTKSEFEDNFQLIIDAINELKTKCSEEIVSIGISAGGPLDSERGIFISPTHLPSWHGVNIKKRVEDVFNIPTFLENDANACALAEYYYGNGKNSKNFAFLTFGTGLGAGLILNGELYKGSNDQAGEIGHVRIAEDGPFCYGKFGSVESYCCGAGISLLHEKLTNQKLSAKEIFDKAEKEHDFLALETVKESSKKLGLTLSILIDLLALDCIVIGSIYSRSQEIIDRFMLDVIDNEILDINKGLCDIKPSLLMENLGDIAAITVAQRGLR
ncbi:MAG: ROK family protein [Sphaerochaetaceae bacterium]|nr:ROK family protein [Sphaerochaetaceae bacterium]MDC7237240.1 ROK family protein [Sphaerochaetaceae bacterium]MDC7250350.1 ROK family protein [Sphaerochaetaceae bacterium]